ncbi:MAG: hypothetical protein EAZ55_12375 [Cytophagales bacterium]|nr:MAG: hypothetical protein EAZ55_12375 [Cytophagales bacterium]
MQKIIISLLLLTLLQNPYNTHKALAQSFAEEYWNNGEVTLQEDEGSTVLKGKIKYNLSENLVQFIDENGNIQTLTARKVLFFKFNDAKNMVERQFYTLPYTLNVNSDYKTPIFFELLLEGQPYSLLCREKLITQTVQNPNYPYSPYGINTPFLTQNVIKNDYFLLNFYDDGSYRLKPFEDRKTLMLVLADREEQIKEHIKVNKLQPEIKSHVISIITYYNSIKQ